MPKSSHPKIEIGQSIKRVAREKRYGPTELGLMVNTSKQNIYGIFKRKSIDTDLLWTFSQALQYDFFETFSQKLGIKQPPPNPDEGLKARIAEQKREIAYLKKIVKLQEQTINGEK